MRSAFLAPAGALLPFTLLLMASPRSACRAAAAQSAKPHAHPPQPVPRAIPAAPLQESAEPSALTIPAASGAQDIIRRDYTGADLPPWIPAHVKRASILSYHLPLTRSFDDLTAYYARSLGQEQWTPTKMQEEGAERYLFYRKGQEKIILHLKPQENLLSVDGLGLAFEDDTPPSDDSFGPSTAAAPLSQTVESFRKGVAVRIVCPAGSVSVRSHEGRDLRFDVMAHAAVDYPRVAAPVLKSLQILTRNEAGGLTLGVGAPAGVSEDAVKLGYTFTVSVPQGTDVSVIVEHPVDPYLDIPDGRVDVSGAVGNVEVHSMGPVSVADALGKVAVETSSDPVLLRNLQGDISAHTTGMWIKAFGINLTGDVDLETTDGQVEAHFAAVRDGSLRCVTTNSAIRVSMPQDASVDLTVRGGKCSIPLDTVPAAQVLVGQAAPSASGTVAKFPALHGVANGGKVPFELVTSGGGMVYIQKK